MKILKFHAEKDCEEVFANLEIGENEIAVSDGLKIGVFEKPLFSMYPQTARQLQKAGFEAEAKTEKHVGECCYCGWQYQNEDAALVVNGVVVAFAHYYGGGGCSCSQ